MSASFAKAVMPRLRRESEPRREPDWTLGWVFSIKTDLPLADGPAAAQLQPAPEAADSTTAHSAPDDLPTQDCP